MQVIILAAGAGSRMGSLTKDNHKSLLKISDQESFLSKLLHQLNEYEIEKVIIVTGYLSDKIEKVVGQFQFNYRLVHNSRYKDDINIYSMKLALDQLSNTSNTNLKWNKLSLVINAVLCWSFSSISN